MDAAHPPVELCVLGGPELLVEGVPVKLGGPKERLLLTLLALHVGRDLDQDRLIAALWQENPPRTAVKSLHSHMWRLRSALSPAGDALSIVTQQRSYRLVAANALIDVSAATELFDAGMAIASSDPEKAIVSFDRALRYWRGRSLGDVADERSVTGEAARLDELHVTIEEERVEALLRLGRHAPAIGQLEALCAEHPLRERLVGLRMTALYRAGRQSDALAVYQALRILLRDEFGLEPGSALSRLEHAILVRSPELDLDPAEPVEDGTVGADALRVLLVDDHPVWRQALRIVLERDNSLTVVGETSDGEDAIALATDTRPAIVLMDIDLGTMGGIEATRRIVEAVPETRVLVLSASADESDVLAALRAGAHGYVLKTGTAQDVVDAVRRVVAGEPVFSPALAPVVLNELRRADV